MPLRDVDVLRDADAVARLMLRAFHAMPRERAATPL